MRACRGRARGRMRRARRSSPASLAGPLAGLAPWPTDDAPSAAVEVPWDDAATRAGDRRSSCSAAAALLVAARGRRRAAPAPSWACGQLVEPELALDERRASPSRCGSCSRACCGPHRDDRRTRCAAESCRRCATRATSRTSSTTHLPPDHPGRALGGARHARRLQSGSLTAYVAYLVALVVVLLVAVRIGLIG